MKTYRRRLEQTVQAEPMTAVEFLMDNPKHKIDGARLSDHRQGYKVIDGQSVSWMSREKFLEIFVEME